jgi:60 kDa SS-A/Ro ribonucleoprotein
MNTRNLGLKNALGRMSTPEIRKELDNLSDPDTTNICGHEAYSIPEELQLLSMLNTLKMEPQYYKSTSEQLEKLQELIEKLGTTDPYFVAQAIVYSRCLGEGMRTVNHVAAALLTPYLRGQEWGKRFFSKWDKKAGRGGCIFRLDDMEEIKTAYIQLNGGGVLANSMKKGFKTVLESSDSYQILKYKKASINIANLVHPNIAKCKGTILVDGVELRAIDALMRGLKVSADTWEVANSEAGQLVAEAKKAGNVTEEEAKELLDAAKAENWNGLLKDKKLGILAALRNIRNILEVCEDVTALCDLLSDEDQIIKGKIMPYQIDMAYEIVRNDCEDTPNKQKVLASLVSGYEASVPNLAEVCTGRNLVILDCSGSMCCDMRDTKTGRSSGSCIDKASLIAATIVQATNADCIQFGSQAEYAEQPNGRNLFDYSLYLRRANMGGTNLATAFNLITEKNKEYDRIFIMSDNECNYGYQAKAYADYIRRVNSPYIYSIDLAAYGTMPLKNTEKVFYFYGYGSDLFTSIASNEFDPTQHIEKVRKVII